MLNQDIGLLLGIGFIAGFLGGLLGVGGGFLVTPALNFLGLPMARAIGTGLAQIAGTSLFAVAKHRRNGHADGKLGTIIGFGMIASVEVGKNILVTLANYGLSDQVIRALFIIMLLSIGTMMLRDGLAAQRQTDPKSKAPGPDKPGLPIVLPGPKIVLSSTEHPVSLMFLIAIGLVAGLLSGLLGVGGGFVLVPIFIYLLHIPVIKAVATSLICVFIASVYGTISFAHSGLVDFATAGLLLAGSIVGSLLGVTASAHADGERLKLLFGVLLLTTALSIGLAAVGYPNVGKVLLLFTAVAITLRMGYSVLRGSKHGKNSNHV